MADLEADIAEVERLIASTTRTTVRDHLQVLQKKLAEQKKRAEQQAAAAAAAAAAASSATASHEHEIKDAGAAAEITYVPINKYGWDQEGMNVTIYITDGVPGVHQIPRDRVQSHFGHQSLDLKIIDLGGQNLRLRIPNLHDAIDVAKCKCLVRENRITIKLVKAKSGYWSKLLSDGTAKTTGKKDDDNASDGLMDLMKKMYDDGDDEMKKTIAKAFSESRQKQGGGL